MNVMFKFSLKQLLYIEIIGAWNNQVSTEKHQSMIINIDKNRQSNKNLYHTESFVKMSYTLYEYLI